MRGNCVKKIYINPQWQGGADLSTYSGAEEIKKYLAGQDFVTLPVSTNEAEMAVRKNGIKGFDALRRQMHLVYDYLQADAPDKIFALGGGCDADVPAIVYLCEKYHGDLSVIWLDAHGDLNAPEESASSLFYGMPLRAVMHNNCYGLLENRCPLSPSHVLHIGGRDLDDAEKAFIRKSGMIAYTVQDYRSDKDFIHRIAQEIQTKHIYFHLDLDVIDPADFPNTPLPVDGGLHCNEVWDILCSTSDKLIGLGIYEYMPTGEQNEFIEKLIQFGSAL